MKTARGRAINQPNNLWQALNTRQAEEIRTMLSIARRHTALTVLLIAGAGLHAADALTGEAYPDSRHAARRCQTR
jgi:hypothetical protein